ncbi:alpha/beta hydrolase family protein [Alistipes sp.]|uniref:alpha/beta hydrolase family protein n=1 Tax=Alistipes sp. TaxID=1872444 RepID=UPI003AEF5D02
MVCSLAACPLAAQPALGERFERPLSAVLADVGTRFGVQVVCKRFSADTVRVPYADFRVRPYSLSETMDNLLHPLGLVWSGGKRITVQPYEYYRRTVADGEKLLAWLAAQYADRAAWEERRRQVLAGVRGALALDPFLRGLVAQPRVIQGPEEPHDGYTTRNYALETLPGVYVCGTVYAPRTAPLSGRNPAARRPLIVAPSGHWPGGRYREDHQRLMATLARMGAVAVDMDIFGWGESEQQVGREAHTAPYAMQMQVLWSKAVTDWIVAARCDIDTARMAATGGSGGATHALLLAAVDGRFAALAPVVHLVSHFDGGCPCESGRPVTLAAGGSCMPEILAAVCAPKPVLTVSDGGDWTASYPALEYPYLRCIWGFYGAQEAVRNVHLPDERHDFGPNKRRAVYDFFARTLGLDALQADESATEVLPEEALQALRGDWPEGSVRSREELEQLLEKLP